MTRETTKAAASAVMAALLSFAAYLYTLVPNVGWGDSAELTVAVHVLGVSHPPGYPLYMLLGKFFTWAVPTGDVAYRVNLMSAFFGAAAVGVMCLVVYRVVPMTAVALPAALAVGFSSTFWQASVVAEVYTLHALFVSLTMLFILLWKDSGSLRYVYLATGTLGISLAHHGMTWLLLPGVVFGLFVLRPRSFTPVELPTALALLTIGLPLYLYLPIRQAAGPHMDFATMMGVDLARPEGLFWYVSGAFYRHALTGWTFQSLYDHFALALGSLAADFLGAGALLAYVGAVQHFKKSPRTFVFFLLLFASNLIFISFYRVVDTQAFAVVLSVLAAPWLAVGAANAIALAEGLGRGTVWRFLPLAGLVLLAIAILVYNWQTMAVYREARSGQIFAQNTLESLPADSVLLFSWPDWPLWYSQRVEGTRPHVELVDIDLAFPRDRSFAGVVPRSSALAVNQELARRYAGRELFMRHYDPEIAAGWRFEDAGAAYRIRSKGVPDITPSFQSASADSPAFGDFLRLQASSVAPLAVQPGALVSVSLVWEVIKTPPADFDLGFRFQMISPEGGQRAFGYRMPQGYGVTPSSGWPPGYQVTESYDLRVPDRLFGGAYTLTLVLGTEQALAPRSDADGVDVVLAEVRVVDGR